jgi:hypothetical protein
MNTIKRNCTKNLLQKKSNKSVQSLNNQSNKVSYLISKKLNIKAYLTIGIFLVFLTISYVVHSFNNLQNKQVALEKQLKTLSNQLEDTDNTSLESLAVNIIANQRKEMKDFQSEMKSLLKSQKLKKTSTGQNKLITSLEKQVKELKLLTQKNKDSNNVKRTISSIETQNIDGNRVLLYSYENYWNVFRSLQRIKKEEFYKKQALAKKAFLEKYNPQDNPDKWQKFKKKQDLNKIAFKQKLLTEKTQFKKEGFWLY